jgi:hypothetical protein
MRMGPGVGAQLYPRHMQDRAALCRGDISHSYLFCQEEDNKVVYMRFLEGGPLLESLLLCSISC